MTGSDGESFAAGGGVEVEVVSDTELRFSRVIRGSVDDVWRAHHDADLMRRWMLGPDGWELPVCELASEIGDSYRYEWERHDDPAVRFGLTGELLEFEPPRREVTTESMIGTEGPGATNDLTLTPRGDGTLLVVAVTYPSVELRDLALAIGMVEGMEASYARLDEVLAEPNR